MKRARSRSLLTSLQGGGLQSPSLKLKYYFCSSSTIKSFRRLNTRARAVVSVYRAVRGLKDIPDRLKEFVKTVRDAWTNEEWDVLLDIPDHVDSVFAEISNFQHTMTEGLSFISAMAPALLTEKEAVSNSNPLQIFSFDDLVMSTANFDPKNVIISKHEGEQNSSNTVYMGWLGSEKIAIKQFKYADWPDPEEFMVSLQPSL